MKSLRFMEEENLHKHNHILKASLPAFKTTTSLSHFIPILKIPSKVYLEILHSHIVHKYDLCRRQGKWV